MNYLNKNYLKNLFNNYLFFFIVFSFVALSSIITPLLFNSDSIKKAEAVVAPCLVDNDINPKESLFANFSLKVFAEAEPCVEPPPPADPATPPVYIVGAAITCQNESDLPDWYRRTDSRYQPFSSRTAQNYVNDSGGRCWLDNGWKFEYMSADYLPPYVNGGYTGDNGTGYTSRVAIPYEDVKWNADDVNTVFGPRVYASMDLDDAKRNNGAYIQFPNWPGEYPDKWGRSPQVSPEMHCYDDSRAVYSNHDYVDQIAWGSTYYCIGFNALVPAPATINVDNSQCSVASWAVNPGGYTGTSNSVSAGTYTIAPNVPPGYTYSVSNSDGGSTSLSIAGGQTKTFNISCTPPSENPACAVANFSANPTSVSYGGETTLSYSSNGYCTNGTLDGGPWSNEPLAEAGYSAGGNTSYPGAMYSTTNFTYRVCNGGQCDSRLLTVPVGDTPPPPPPPPSIPPCSVDSFPPDGEYGGVVYPTWTTSNSNNVVLSGGQFGSGVQVEPDGYRVINIDTDTLLTVTANAGATCSPSDSQSAWMFAESAPPPPPPPPPPPAGTPPSTPTGLDAATSYCGSDWLNISWNASGGATTYQVYRDGILVYNGSDLAFSDINLYPTGSYAYTITASNADGTSPLSGPVYGTVASPCDAPPPPPPPAPPSAGFDYNLSNNGVTPSPVKKGASNVYAQTTITVNREDGTAEPVTFSLTGAPSGVSTSFAPTSCTPSNGSCNSTLTLTIPSTTAIGNYLIRVTGSPLSKSTTFNLNIENSTALIVTCSASPSTGRKIGEPVTWTATATGGSGSYASYSWSGTAIPTAPAPTSNPYTITYSTTGTKTARATVTDSLGNIGTCPDATTIINFNPVIIEF